LVEVCESSTLEDFATIVEPSDVAILAALGHAERLAIVELLMEARASQATIRARLELRSGTASKHLAILEERRLVARNRSHGAYGLVRPRETLVVIEAAAALASATSRTQAEADEERLRAVERMRMRRGADIADA